MSIDYYKCDVCGECLPDCSVTVKTCKENHGMCDDCRNKVINLKEIKYWNNSEPAIEDEWENILPEFCPSCRAKERK